MRLPTYLVGMAMLHLFWLLAGWGDWNEPEFVKMRNGFHRFVFGGDSAEVAE